MDMVSVVAAIIVILAAATFIGIKFYRSKKDGGDINITIDEFIDKYGSAVIKAMQSAVELLSVNMDSFDTKAEYQEAVVRQTIIEIRENAADLGLDLTLLKLFNDDALTAIILNILDKTTNMSSVSDMPNSNYRTRMAANVVNDSFQKFK